MKRHAFRLAFAEGLRADERTVRVQQIAELALPSGTVVAHEPGVGLGEARPFLFKVPPGDYPVFLTSLEEHSDPGQVELASIRFAPGVPVRWENARTRPASSDKAEGYPVDGGTGCFCDPTAAQVFGRDERLYEQFSAARHGLLTDGTAQLVFFRSGAGDGVYASYVGFDADGAALQLVTDFACGALNERARGGPWDEDQVEGAKLRCLWDYLLDHGAPIDAWRAEFLPTGELAAVWQASHEGVVMRAMLEGTSHPQLAEVLHAELSVRAELYDSLGVPEFAEPVLALQARLRAGGVAAHEALRELSLIESKQEALLRKRFPLSTRGEPAAYERVRSTRRLANRQLAEELRVLVPSPPSLETLVAVCARNGPAIRRAQW